MNRKHLIILVVAGLLVGGVAFLFSNAHRAEYESKDAGVGTKLLGDFPINEVAAVTIRSRDGSVNLAKKEVWTVQERSNYPAGFTEIADLIRKLWDLKPVQSQPIGPSQWGRLDLLMPGTPDAGTNTATVVELKDKEGKPLRTVLLGKQQMRDSGGQFGGFPVGRWVAVPDNKETVFVVSESFSEVEPKPENWLNKDFFKVEKLGGVSLLSTNPAQSWSLSRPSETGEWTLDDKKPEEELDKNKLSSFSWAFSSPSFNDVHPKSADAVKDAFASATTLRLDTFDGFHYEVKVGSQPDADSYFISVQASADLPAERTPPADEKPEDKEKNEQAWKEQQDKLKEKLKKEKALGDWVYKVSKWTVDSLLKERSALLAEKKPESATGAVPSSAEDSDGPLTFPPLPGPITGDEPAPPVIVPSPE